MTAAEKLVEALVSSSSVCAVAESCTGGGVGSAITSVPGSSAVFAGGIVSYSNEVKEKVLGVSAENLSRFGAVSALVAEEMAVGARRLTGADIAVSVTGIAGPGGGSASKPVGLVWFAVSSDGCVRSEKALFDGDRGQIRAMAVERALELLLRAAIERGKTG